LSGARPMADRTGRSWSATRSARSVQRFIRGRTRGRPAKAIVPRALQYKGWVKSQSAVTVLDPAHYCAAFGVNMSTLYLQNCWYQAAWSDEVTPGNPLIRTLLDVPILFFRPTEGQIAALHDRCPHRFAPLSAGKIEGNLVTCGYHGLGFNSHGTCVRNPHGGITKAMHVRAFQVIERHQAIWIWFGDKPARPEDIPNLAFIDETPKKATISSHMHVAANYRLLTDNILDLSHADYLHPSSLGGIMTGAKTTITTVGEKIQVVWDSINCVPPPAFMAMVPPPDRADIWTEVIWTAPAIMVLGTGATKTGVVRTPLDEAYTLHSMSPESATSSHYFMCSTRRFLVDDDGFSAMLKGALSQAFNHEDKPMLEKQQARMGTDDLWSLKPVMLGIDNAAVQARRMLDKLIARELQEREESVAKETV
jgi:phenylpropionate dioxygenase-like ring-hydroxylating dioxygenase large terminal subunit